jgi:hypothetical protein
MSFSPIKVIVAEVAPRIIVTDTQTVIEMKFSEEFNPSNMPFT